MPENSSARGRLDSWKEIADYLKRDIRTAIRWGKHRGMPVHRVPGGKRQAVFVQIPVDDHHLAMSSFATCALVRPMIPATNRQPNSVVRIRANMVYEMR